MKVNYKFSKNPLSGAKYKVVRTKSSLTDKRTIEFEYVEGSSVEIKGLQENDVLMLESDFIDGNREDLLIVESEDKNIATLRGFHKPVMRIKEFEDDAVLLFIARIEYEKE